MNKKIISVLAYFLKSPTKALISTWIVWAIVLVSLPFSYTTPPSVLILGFIVGCILCFSIGDLITKLALSFAQKGQSSGWRGSQRSLLNPERIQKNLKRLDRIILSLAIVGLLGGSLFVMAKFSLSGLNFSDGVTGARLQRANDILSGNAGDTPFITYIGLLTFPCSSAAFLASFLHVGFTKNTLRWSRLSIISPFAVTIVTGGRGGILQILVMFLSTILIRRYRKEAPMHQLISPKARKSLKTGKLFLVMAILFAVYNVYVFNSRRELTNSNFGASLVNWEQNYGIYPSPFLENMVSFGILDGDLLLNVMQTYFYLTSGPSVFTILENSQVNIGPYFGIYQVGLLSSFVDKFFADISPVPQMMSELAQARIVGLLPSAWGMMFVDFGFLGTLLEAFALGCLSRIVYFLAIHRGWLGDKLMFSFVVMAIVMSPIAAPLGFSDSFFTLIVFLVVGKTLNHISRNVSHV